MIALFLHGKVLSAFTIFTILFLFYVYYDFAKRKVLLNLILRSKYPSLSRESLEFVSEKFSGILFTGITPFILFVLILKLVPSEIGFTVGQTIQLRYPIILLTTLTALVSFFSSKNPKIQERSPELRIRIWYPRHLLLTVLSWGFYIFGFEFFFRGILWFICYGVMGFWPAIAINIVLYSLVHIPKGKLMTFGAIPIGVIFCLLSHLTGSFYPAFLVHACMAIVTEIFSAYHNPEFQFRLSKSGK